MKFLVSIITIFSLAMLNYQVPTVFGSLKNSHDAKYEESLPFVHICLDLSYKQRSHDRSNDLNNPFGVASAVTATEPTQVDISQIELSKANTQLRSFQIFKLHCAYLC